MSLNTYAVAYIRLSDRAAIMFVLTAALKVLLASWRDANDGLLTAMSSKVRAYQHNEH